MKALGRVFGWRSAVAGLCSLGLLSACGDSGYAGPVARLTGSFNDFAKGDRAPALRWDGSSYRGMVDLPADSIQVQIYLPTTRELVGGSGQSAGVPGRLLTTGTAGPGAGGEAGLLRLETPLPARYAVIYEPAQRRLHIDFAEGAEQQQPPGAAELVTALRGSDRVPPAERQARAEALARSLQELGVETPLRAGEGARQAITFLRFGRAEGPLSVVGDFNDWTEGRDAMQPVLDGNLAYCGRTASGVRLEYRFALHGQRHSDPLNPEVIWDGAYLPGNLQNVLGGNVGEFNSVAMTLGYTEHGSRLRRLEVQGREVLVYLPPGYDHDRRDYPSIYIHDGKDAIVRGRYNQALDRLAAAGAIPKVVAVFIPARSEPLARLAEFTHVRDPYFADVEPNAPSYERFLFDAVMPEVERRFRVRKSGAERAMLGIDMAGPLSFHIAWSDPERRFLRVASQSGRFGWGSTDPTRSPYVNLLRQDRSQMLKKLSFDWADGDPFQVQIHDSVLRPLIQNNAAYQGKSLFLRQERPPQQPSPSVWDGWRARLDPVLAFLLGDLK